MAVEPATLYGDNQVLFEALPADGTTTSNPALQKGLGWDSDRYFRSRDALVDMGLVVRGRGRGGVVRRVLSDTAVDERTVSVVVERRADGLATAATVEAAIKNELALYEPMRKVIATDLAKDYRRDPLAVEITALQGRRAATYSYVLLHVPDNQTDPVADDIADVSEAARTHGVGVITAANPEDYDTWEEREEARRVEPDPERLNAFVATQLSDNTRDLISRRLR